MERVDSAFTPRGISSMTLLIWLVIFQIEQLHKISFNGDSENYRPIQKLNRRSLTVMTFEDKNYKAPMSCAKPSKAEKALCLLLALTGVVPAFRV